MILQAEQECNVEQLSGLPWGLNITQEARAEWAGMERTHRQEHSMPACASCL